MRYKLEKIALIIKLIARQELTFRSGLHALRAMLLAVIVIGFIANSSAQTIGLHVAENHNVLFGNSLSGAGTKLIWVPDKQSLFAGSVTGLQWDPDSIFENNIIFGIDNQSSTEFVTINGQDNTVSGLYSAVFGVDNKVIEGKWSLLNGRDNLVESDASYGIINGWSNRASYEAEYTILNGRSNKIGREADYTTVNGFNNIANTSFETVLGRYADSTVVSNYDGSWNDNHQLFAIGNGTSTSDRNNALTLLKNGNIGINTSNPGTLLHVESTQATGRSIVLSLVAGTSKRPSIQFSEHPNLPGELNSGMSIEYDGRLGGEDNKIYINSIKTGAAGSGLPVVTFKNDGDVDITGFVKIGDAAPAVKYKSITLNTPNSAASFSSADHGLDQTKIIGMQASLVDGATTLFPNERINSWRYNVMIKRGFRNTASMTCAAFEFRLLDLI